MAGKMKVGILGLGAIGTIHARALGGVPGAEVAALCDANGDLLRTKGAEFGVERLYDDYRGMMKDGDIDAVFVSVPNFLHCETTLAAFRAGKHVLCEKPMAMNASEGRRMVAAAKKAGKVLQVGMVMRQRAASLVLRDYVVRGRLGKVYHMRLCLRRRRGVPGLGGWFTTKAKAGGGAMIDIGVHFLDLAMWLTDNWKAERISAQTYAKFGPRMKDYVYVGMWAGPPNYRGVCDVDDYASGLIRFHGDATLSFEISWAQNVPQTNFLELLGDQGGARLAGDDLQIMGEQDGRLVDITPHFAKVNPYEIQAAKFVDACLGRGDVPATGEQGLAVMEVLDAVYKSSRLGREVPVIHRRAPRRR